MRYHTYHPDCQIKRNAITQRQVRSLHKGGSPSRPGRRETLREAMCAHLLVSSTCKSVYVRAESPHIYARLCYTFPNLSLRSLVKALVHRRLKPDMCWSYLFRTGRRSADSRPPVSPHRMPILLTPLAGACRSPGQTERIAS